MRDFDLLAANAHRVMYGATLVFRDDAEAKKREPGAAPTSERMHVLREAHNKGIRTWVSLEPVYHHEDTFALIEATRGYVDVYKVGKLNYRPEANEIDWRKFAVEVEEKLKSTGKEYYIKSDLRRCQNDKQI